MKGALCFALALTACSQGRDPAAARTTDQAAQSACGPVPTLVMSQDGQWPASLREGGADLAALRANFAAGFAAACSAGVIPATGPVDRQGKAFDTIEVVHNPDANQLFMDRGVDRFAGRMYMQEIFFMQDGTVRIPTPEDFLYEFTCVMKPPSDDERERTGDCMYD